MATDSEVPDPDPQGGKGSDGNVPGGNGSGDSGSGDGTPPHGNIVEMPIEEELKNSYLTYAMSVIVSRALPDVRDGLKPSQRRILVAMNDLNLSSGAARVKCAKISGDTSGNYHPHGESVIYPTLVRMAQEWNMRYVLIDKQGNFGSIAGLPPAAMRYTEARMSAAASHDAGRPEPGYGRFPADLRRAADGTDGATVPISEPVGQRRERDRRRHGDVDSAAQSGRNLRRADGSHRRPGNRHRRIVGDLPRPRLPHRRNHLRP